MSDKNYVYISDEHNRDEILLSIIDHHRHNWLNDLQLLFGYTQLKKYDQLLGFLEKVKQRLEAERLLSNVALPSLAVDLMFFIQQHHKFELTVNMMQDDPLYHQPDLSEKIRSSIMGTLRLYERLANKAAERPNELIINSHIDDAYMSLFFLYKGAYDEQLSEEVLRSFAAEIQEQGVKISWQLIGKQINIELTLVRPKLA